jgi:hypothetical protein
MIDSITTKGKAFQGLLAKSSPCSKKRIENPTTIKLKVKLPKATLVTISINIPPKIAIYKKSKSCRSADDTIINNKINCGAAL